MFLAIAFFNCTKDSNGGGNSNEKDTVKPQVHFVLPVNNQVVNQGEMIRVEANGTDNIKLTQLHIHITNQVTGSILRDVHSYPGGVSGTVKDSFYAQTGLIYKIQVLAYDPSQNMSVIETTVTVN